MFQLMLNQKVETSRDRILRVASAEFGQRGFEGARMARIADAAGVNKQLLFHYFGSKTGLYAAAVGHAAAELTAALRLENPTPSATDPLPTVQPSILPAPDRLRAEARRVLSTLSQRRGLLRLILLDVLRAEGPRPETRELFELLVLLFRKPVSDGQGLGFFRDDVDPELASVQILVSLLGFLGSQPALPPKFSAQQGRWVEASSELWVRGMGW